MVALQCDQQRIGATGLLAIAAQRAHQQRQRGLHCRPRLLWRNAQAAGELLQLRALQLRSKLIGQRSGCGHRKVSCLAKPCGRVRPSRRQINPATCTRQA